MKSQKLFLAFLLFLGLLFLSIFTAVYGQRQIDTTKLEKQIDSIMLPLVKNNLLSGTVLIAVNDAIVFQKAFGMANVENGIQNKEDTKFEIASITKMFTAISIMQLYERGKLDLQDKLIKYLPDFTPGNKITIYNLLTHTSGLPSYYALGKNHADFKEVISWIKALSLKFEPSTDFEYSNSGYALLAFVIENISGLTYEDYLRHNIFIPCEMNHSGMIPLDPALTARDLAKGYSTNESGGLQRSEWRGPLGKGDGALYSTSGDMYKFSKALFNHTLLSPKYLELMFKSVKQSHGIGCIVEDYKG
jgi:CubicO group peptidase (beta-lactamase class C family)